MPDEPVPPPGAGAGLTQDLPPNVHDLLGVTIVEATPERVVLTMPVDWKVHQGMGLLHGGASALLAESAASIGAAVNSGRRVVGIELNASHLRPMREGVLTATATPVRAGRTVQVWEISLTDPEDREVCRSRCSIAVLAEGVGPGAAGGPA